MTEDEEDLRVERARRLIDAPPVTPQIWEVDVVRRAVALARTTLDLDLPDRFVVHWRFHVPDAARGAHADGAIYLGLESGSTRDDLAGVLFHELQHLSDHHAGRAFDRAEWETRAELFAGLMAIHWRAGTAPADDEEEDMERGAVQTPRPPPLPSREAQARGLLEQIERRIERIVRLVDGESMRHLRVIGRQVGELGELASRKR